MVSLCDCGTQFQHATAKAFCCPDCKRIVRYPSGLTLSELRQLGHALEGTPRSPETILETNKALDHLRGISFDLTDLEDDLLNVNIECCKGCEWWHECCELNDYGYCNDCNPENW